MRITDTIEDCGSPHSAAAAPDLVYCSDDGAGISRRRSGRGFSYRAASGETIRDPQMIARIARLAIPPAWTDVWICEDACGHIQATGRDARGRKQYRYHDRWTAARGEAKYARLIDFARTLPLLRRRIEADLGLPGLPREKVLASVVWLLDNAMIRVGNRSYARENGSFGLTTLRDRHVRIAGSRLRFSFRGKSGKDWSLSIVDRRIARIVRSAQELPGQHLFQYLDDSGARREIGSHDVNAYLREVSCADWSSRHFRTWGGTVRAGGLLAVTEYPDSKRAAAQVLNAAIDEVAAKLGNTRSVCRQCYVHPLVFEAWQDGRLGTEMAALRARFRRPPAGLERDEMLMLRWLESHCG